MHIKFTKKQWFISATVIFILIPLAGFAILFYAFDPNEFKDKITQSVKQAIGRELVIDGKIHLSVFPWIGLKISNISLANPPDFGKEPMIRIQEADIQVKLLSLLYRKPQTKVLILKKPEIILIRDQNGRSNRDDFKSKPQKEESSESMPDILKDLMVAGIKISDGQLVFEDRQKKTLWRFDKVNLETGIIKIGEPVMIKAGVNIDSENPKLSLTASSENILLDIKNSLVKTDDLNLAYLISNISVISLKTAVSLDWKKEFLNLTGLNLSGYGLKIYGDAQTENLFSKPHLSASLGIQEFSPKILMPNIAMNKASAKFRLSLNSESTDFSDILMMIDETELKGKISIKQFKPIHAEFDLTADRFDLNRYLPASKESKQKTEHHNFLKDTEINGNLRVAQFKAYKINASDLRLTVSEKDGRLSVKPLLASIFSGNLNADVSADFREKSMPIGINLRLSGANAGEFIRETSGKTLISNGKTDISLQIAGHTPEFLNTLNGKADISLYNAVLKGYNIPGLIELGGYPFKALLQKVGVYKEEPAETAIRNLNARFDIKNGNAISRELSLKTPNVKMTASGSTHLARKTVDAQLSADFDNIVNIPISVKGTYQKPEIFVNPASVVVNSAANIVGLPLKLGKEVITNPKGVGKKIIEAPINIGESLLKKATDVFGTDKKKKKK